MLALLLAPAFAQPPARSVDLGEVVEVRPNGALVVLDGVVVLSPRGRVDVLHGLVVVDRRGVTVGGPLGVALRPGAVCVGGWCIGA